MKMEEVIFKNSNIFYNVLCFLIAENEKLFDRSEAKLYWTTVYHLFGILHHVYIALFSSSLKLTRSEFVHLDNLSRFNGGYLTGWNFLFQTCFLTMSITYDFLAWTDRHETSFGRRLKYYTDLLFSGVVVPLTMFICSMFWCVYWIDRELVFPKVYDQIIPWWFNHCVHTNIMVVILLETLLRARRHPANLKIELWMNGFIGVAYAVVYYSIFFFSGRWLYGVFAIMTWWQVCLYQIMIWASTFLFYYIQFPVNRLFHKAEFEESPEKTTQKTDSNVFSLDAWHSKLRPKGLAENSNL